MNKFWPPQDNVLWYLKRTPTKPCTQNMHVDVAIVGGGMAGLSAAQEFAKKGKKVALFEQYFCGSGASGKSSGLITPNAELSLTDFTKRFNLDVAFQIWQLINSGVENIRNNIVQHAFECGYQPQDSLVLANSVRSLNTLQTEVEMCAKLNYQTFLYDAPTVQNYIGSKKYVGGMLYPNTFSINAYAYCQALKKHLEAQGVLIFEETPVTKVSEHTLTTAHANITADYIVVCTDKNIADLNLLVDDVYHAQTFIMTSQQLTEQEIRTIFPDRNLMVWDTQFIYNYFRMTSDQRLLLGGGDIFSSYASKETHNYARITQKLTNYFKEYFPQLDLQFEYQWPGLIGLSKDIAPIMGRDKDFNHIFYVTAATGLPIACALGVYSAQHLLDNRNDMDAYFSPYRKFPVGGVAQKILGKKLSFMISNVIKQNVP